MFKHTSTTTTMHSATCVCIFLLGLTYSTLSQATNQILNPLYMNRNVQACEDFYNYANGRWLANNSTPHGWDRYTDYDEMLERNWVDIQTILRQASITPITGTMAERLIGAYYRSGRDAAAITAAGISPLRSGFTLIDGINSKTDILPVLGKLHKIGVMPIFNFSVQKNPSGDHMIAHLNPGGLGLYESSLYSRNSKMRSLITHYEAHIKAVFELAGFSPEIAGQQAKVVVQVEKNLANALRAPNPDSQLTQIVRIENLSTGIRRTNWNQYFSEIGLASHHEIFLNSPHYFNWIGLYLERIPLSSWKAYLRWNLINTKGRYLTDAFAQENANFLNKIFPRYNLQPLSLQERVQSGINNHLQAAVNHVYALRKFNPESKVDVSLMVNNLRATLAEMVNNVDWMSTQTKTIALDKIDRITSKIAYPDQWHDYSDLASAITMSNSDPHAFFKLNNAIAEHKLKHMISKIGHTAHQDAWPLEVHSVSGFYYPRSNELVLPAGILQAHYYHYTADLASNYGSIGSYIAHELIHAVDENGRQFDAQGNKQDWWSKQDEAKFNQRSTEIIDQFNAFSPQSGFYVDGRLTKMENIADLGGLRLAYKATPKGLVQTSTTRIN